MCDVTRLMIFCRNSWIKVERASESKKDPSLSTKSWLCRLVCKRCRLPKRKLKGLRGLMLSHSGWRTYTWWNWKRQGPSTERRQRPSLPTQRKVLGNYLASWIEWKMRLEIWGNSELRRENFRKKCKDFWVVTTMRKSSLSQFCPPKKTIKIKVPPQEPEAGQDSREATGIHSS